MSRDFNGTTDYLHANVAAATAMPITMACWFKPDQATIQVLMQLSTWGSSGHFYFLATKDAASGRKVYCATNGGSFASAVTTTAYTVGQWHHHCGVFAAANDRRVYLDGGGKGTNSTSTTPSGVNHTAIGRLDRGISGTYPFDGPLAEVAIWTAALTDAEVAQLATGLSPLALTHRLGELVLYQDLIRNANRPGVGPTMTSTGTTAAAHPRVWCPPSRNVFLPRRVAGPYTLAAGACELTGAAAGELYLPGAIAGEMV